MGRLLPADTALNFSVEYQSVVAFGSADLIEDPVEAERALQLILDKYFPHLQPGKDYRPITEGELSITAVYRMEVEEWSGKRKAVDETFPGAFFWENLPS
jgi:nitroimidazol reductase NimA-like FMN-containing flavoprotein (pyridoxamine 5'-phosphate oxidase superfamily)